MITTWLSSVSFQLDNMYKFRANIAVLMNITPDHLDRYNHCMQNYVDADHARPVHRKMPSFFPTHDPIRPWTGQTDGLLRSPLSFFPQWKRDGAIAYVEDGEVEINEPIAF